MENFTLEFLGRDAGFGKNNNSAYYEDNKTLLLIDCGFTVFQQLKKKFDFNKYKEINIIITHLHNDHAGSLSQFILYMWFIYNKKVTIFSNCKDIKKYLDITGVPPESYSIKRDNDNLKFIKVPHSPYLDTYGFKIKLNNKNIIYTSDTSNIQPFLPYIAETDELYIDVSRYGGIHIKIDDIIENINEFLKQNINIALMHLDDKEYIQKTVKDKLDLSQQNLDKLDF